MHALHEGPNAKDVLQKAVFHLIAQFGLDQINLRECAFNSCVAEWQCQKWEGKRSKLSKVLLIFDFWFCCSIVLQHQAVFCMPHVSTSSITKEYSSSSYIPTSSHRWSTVKMLEWQAMCAAILNSANLTEWSILTVVMPTVKQCTHSTTRETEQHFDVFLRFAVVLEITGGARKSHLLQYQQKALVSSPATRSIHSLIPFSLSHYFVYFFPYFCPLTGCHVSPPGLLAS